MEMVSSDHTVPQVLSTCCGNNDCLLAMRLVTAFITFALVFKVSLLCAKRVVTVTQSF